MAVADTARSKAALADLKIEMSTGPLPDSRLGTAGPLSLRIISKFDKADGRIKDFECRPRGYQKLNRRRYKSQAHGHFWRSSNGGYSLQGVLAALMGSRSAKHALADRLPQLYEVDLHSFVLGKAEHHVVSFPLLTANQQDLNSWKSDDCRFLRSRTSNEGTIRAEVRLGRGIARAIGIDITPVDSLKVQIVTCEGGKIAYDHATLTGHATFIAATDI